MKCGKTISELKKETISHYLELEHTGFNVFARTSSNKIAVEMQNLLSVNYSKRRPPYIKQDGNVFLTTYTAPYLGHDTLVNDAYNRLRDFAFRSGWQVVSPERDNMYDGTAIGRIIIFGNIEE
jgi:hypothetical protein